MIKENQKILNALNILADAPLVVFSMLLAYITRFYIMRGAEAVPLGFYIASALAVSPLIILLFGAAGLYESQRSSDFLRTAEKVAGICLIGTIALATVFFIIRSVDASRWLLTFFYIYTTLLLTAKRYAVVAALRSARAKGRNLKYVLLIGSGESAASYFGEVDANRHLGLRVIGSVGSRPVCDGLARLGGMEALERALETAGADEAVAALSADEIGCIGEVIAACEKHGVKLSVIPFCAPYLPSHPRMDAVGGVPLINIRYIPLDNIVYNGIKRLCDIVLSMIMMALLSPLFAIAAVGTALSVGRPIIFKQTRVGLNKKHFTMYKFRSMKGSEGGNDAWSASDSARLTPFSAFMRKYSIDELPQLFNVFKGDMSIIGPRPELPRFVEQFKESVPLYMVKHQVRPGMTGWAQVNGYRGDTSIVERIRCDLYYIENWSLFLDLKILIMTLLRITNNEEVINNGAKKEKRKIPGKDRAKNDNENESSAQPGSGTASENREHQTVS